MSAMTHHDLTGLVLAGGQARRMGGVDKGLQMLAGRALSLHVIERLRPQVAQVLISANRNLERYRAYGHPVIADTDNERLGPLAGMLAGMHAARTSHLLCVPCDVPQIPESLAAVLIAAATARHRSIAYAVTDTQGQHHCHPVCAILACDLADDLQAYLDAGGRKVGAWYARHNAADASFPDERAFYNVNSLQDLDELARVID
jgi:molybdopterin-guanine dinucleotide biosynthesis protein A